MKSFNVTESDIAELVQSKLSADNLLWQLKEIKNSNFSTNQLSEFLQTNLPFDTKEKINSLLTKNYINLNDNASNAEFFQFLSDRIEKIPIVELTLSYSPPEKVLRNVSNQLFQTYNKAFLISTTVDPSIIGGAVVCYKGLMRDYSIKKMFSSL